jgi:ribonuclease J
MDRLVTIYRAAKRAERELVLPGQVGYIVMQIGNKNLPNFRNFKDVKKFTSNPERPHEIGLETIKKNPEKYVVFLTYKITRALLDGGLFNKDAVYIWSLWDGYKKQENTAQLIAEIAATNTKIAKDIHSSGHADRATIIEFVDKLNPKRLVPVHTAFPEAFKSLEWKNGFTGQVEIHVDNEWFEV